MKTGWTTELWVLTGALLLAFASAASGQWPLLLPADPDATPEQIRRDVRRWIGRQDALGHYVNPGDYGVRAMPALREVLENHDQHIDSQIRGALGLLSRVARPEPNLFPLIPLIEPHLLADHVGVRSSATRALGAVGGQQVTAALVSQLYDAHPSVRAAALRTLGEYGGPDALQALRIWRHQARAADEHREYRWLGPSTERSFEETVEKIRQRAASDG